MLCRWELEKKGKQTKQLLGFCPQVIEKFADIYCIFQAPVDLC